MEEALRTLEDEPLKGRKIRLEKVCSGGIYYLCMGGYSYCVIYHQLILLFYVFQ